MMTKKTMTILSVFMIVALTAVGFAAWLIVGTIEAETTGSFVSNELKDKYFKVEVDFDTTTDKENGQIIFGRPEAAYVNSNNAWLSYSNKDAVEHLTSTATVKFIPDDGFSRNVANQEDRDMKYFLLKQTENAAGEVTKEEYRTVRVVIDIAEALGADYKWFDMAVQLGYIQYPTAFVIEKNADGEPLLKGANNDEKQTFENVDAEYKFGWYTSASAAKEATLTGYAGKDYEKFQGGCLILDLTADMFTIGYENAEDKDAKEATAEIQIDFKWGEALKETIEGKVVYSNPYDFFKNEARKPENTLDIDFYLDSTDAIKETVANIVDDPDTVEVEVDNNPEDNKTIRYKDLAQRMLDYLRDRLNYEAAVYEDGLLKTEQKGIQFSITLVEGIAIPKA